MDHISKGIEGKARHMLKKHEGFVSHVYEDSTPEKYLTIGYGRLVDKRLGGGISQDEANYLLLNDIRNCIKILETQIPVYKELSENRQIVLINMYFNLGNRLFNFKNMLAALDKKDFDEVAVQMLDSKWATQVKGRSSELAKMMKEDIYET
jgi:lysozyme